MQKYIQQGVKMDNIQEDNNSLQFLLEENAKLSNMIRVLSKQLEIATAGLEALVQNCNDYALNISKATLEEIKNFTNRWLGKACQNGGSIPIQMEHAIEKKVKQHKRYVEQATQDSAGAEWRQSFIENLKKDLVNKKKVNK